MKATKRDLAGRTIVDVNFRRFRTTPEGTTPRSMSRKDTWVSDPLLTLDNGRKVWFVTEETEVGEYGTTICISDNRRSL